MSEEFRGYGERGEEHLLREIIELLQENQRELKTIVRQTAAKLSTIEIRFGGTMQGPITLTPSAKATKATVLGFDQNGAPFTGTIPSVTYTPDSTSFASFTSDGANGDDLVGLADGTTNLAATLTTTEGLSLTDTTQIITSGFVVVPPPVLTTIKLDFTQPA